MKVIIKEVVVEYISDYDKEWKFSSGDSFKYPVVLNGCPCFIKRFAKSKEKISGWKLLTDAKRKNIDGLSRIYDFVSDMEKKFPSDTENNLEVFYLFYEYAEGRTLNEVDSLRSSAEIKRLGEDLLTGFIGLFSYQHWFPDFCDKNVLWNNRGRFLFIDLDSAEAFSKTPDRDMDGSKAFWVPVLEFYKTIRQLRDFSPGMLHGSSFNILQLLFFVLDARLKLHYKSTGKMNSAHIAYARYPAILSDLVPGVNDFFNKVLQNGTKPFSFDNKTIEEIKSMIALIADAGDDKISGTDAPSPKPAIKLFTSSTSKVSRQESFTLSWQVDNATNIVLYRNNAPYKTMENGEQSVTLKEFNDDIHDVQYHLVATNGSQETASQPVWIRLKRKRKLLFPLIGAGIAAIAIIAGVIFIVQSQRTRFVVVERIAYEDSVFRISVAGQEKIMNGITVLFNGIQAAEANYFNRQVTAKVPSLNISGRSIVIDIKDAGGKTLFSTGAEYIPVTVKDISEKEVYEGDSITFYGENLNHGNTDIWFTFQQRQIHGQIIAASYDRIVARVPTLMLVPFFSPIQVKLIHNSRELLKKQGNLKIDKIDLKALAHSAEWQSGVITSQNYSDPTRFDDPKPLPFPGTDADGNGFALLSASQAENNALYSALRTHPRWVPYGIIRGFYKQLHLKGRRYFDSDIGFIQRIPSCTNGVLFQVYVHYTTADGTKDKQLCTQVKTYTGQVADLRSSYFPDDVPDDFTIELRVDTYGGSECDWAAWFSPQIIARKITF